MFCLAEQRFRRWRCSCGEGNASQSVGPRFLRNATREVLASKHIPLPAEAQLNRNLIDTGENVDLGWLDGRSRHLKIFLPFRSTEDQ